MLKLMNLLAPAKGEAMYALWFGLSLTLVILMAVAALFAIVFILMQPSNSTGVSALGGSSETFFGKNKGKSIEAKMKKWTIICLIVLAVLSIAFFVLQIDAIWVRA